jgi:hypothetical protein
VVKKKFIFYGIGTAFNTLAVIMIFEAVSLLRQLVVILFLWMPRFNPFSVYMRSVMGKVALGQVFL